MGSMDLTKLTPEEFAAYIEELDAMPPDESWWENWYATAVAAGVPAHVADVGRALFRALFVDDDIDDRWDDDISRLAGFDDDGHGMIQLALARPRTALRVWQRIVETSGLRGEHTGAGWLSWDQKRRNRERDVLLSEVDRSDAHRLRALSLRWKQRDRTRRLPRR
jgi:hypothetical protein